VFTEEALARTYSHPSYADPYEVVEDYRRVAEYRLSHPDAGSTAVARALELPRSRVRPWLDGSAPDPVHAVQDAQRNGWLDAPQQSELCGNHRMAIKQLPSLKQKSEK
jgi:hypothetical protein